MGDEDELNTSGNSSKSSESPIKKEDSTRKKLKRVIKSCARDDHKIVLQQAYEYMKKLESDLAMANHDLHNAIAQNNKLNEKILLQSRETEKEELLKEQAIGKQKAYKMRLSGRGSLDFAEELLLPIWLRNTQLRRSQKWTISLRFKMTPHAASLMESFKKLKSTRKLQPPAIGRLIEEIYDEWAKTFTHKMRITLPSTDDQWASMFQKLKIDNENNRTLLQVILKQSLGDDSLDDSPEEIIYSPVRSSNCGYIVINNVNRNAKLSNIEEYFQRRNLRFYGIEHLIDTTETPHKRADKIVVFVENMYDAALPSIIENAPANLYYQNRWEVEEKVRYNEP